MGRGARDTTGRMLAATGHLSEIRPQFAEPGGCASMLLKEGLLNHAVPVAAQGVLRVDHRRSSWRSSSWPGCAIRRRSAPGPGNGALGLDRCPEVRRCKIKALGQDVRKCGTAILPGGGMARRTRRSAHERACEAIPVARGNCRQFARVHELLDQRARPSPLCLARRWIRP